MHLQEDPPPRIQTVVLITLRSGVVAVHPICPPVNIVALEEEFVFRNRGVCMHVAW